MSGTLYCFILFLKENGLVTLSLFANPLLHLLFISFPHRVPFFPFLSFLLLPFVPLSSSILPLIADIPSIFNWPRFICFIPSFLYTFLFHSSLLHLLLLPSFQSPILPFF